ncbi:MAG: class I SAM-dependent methyltransferase [Clostridiales bacterium]|nr:class I SAM-dependent methyltransferase [Candidatus Equinaster intestinalis]
MAGYGDFAYYYDLLTTDVDYEKRAEQILSLFEKYDRKPTLLLDMACGTGGFSLEFSKNGIQVIGVDPSADMLSIARDKTAEAGEDILYLNQTAQELELYGTVDGAVCCLDSLNHITDYNELKIAIQKISLFLEPQRLFIFDVNTEYKHREILADNCFVRETEDVFCVWQNSFDEQTKITDISIDIFCDNGDTYDRMSEDFSERAYSNEEIENALKNAGFKTEAIFGELSDCAPKQDAQRVIYVARKVK